MDSQRGEEKFVQKITNLAYHHVIYRVLKLQRVNLSKVDDSMVDTLCIDTRIRNCQVTILRPADLAGNRG